MNELFDPLLSDEKGKDLLFDDDQIKSGPLIELAEQSDEEVIKLLERENDYLPNHDYLIRLRSADSDLAARTDAFNWIFKAHSYYSFGPLSLCLAVNYLDRFFSFRQLPKDKAWTVQLLAVACLSIAAKIEETSVPQSVELQVGDPKYVFEAKTIQRMELLVLDTLKWKMNVITPCSFLHYSLKTLFDKFLVSTSKVVNRSMQLILCAIKGGIEYLEFKASEIAAGVAISVSAEIQAVDIDKASSSFIHLEKGRLIKCIEMIKEVSQTSGGIPRSPIGVLEARCFTFKSDDLTSSSTSTRTRSPQPKRMKLDPTLIFDS